jgi:methylamine--corrinoid protein Co-methyltransferase
MSSNWLPEIVRRSEAGPFMREADFDRALARRARELTQSYHLKYDPQVLVPSDDELACRLFQAALDLFVDLGVYNQSTERRILFSRAEVLEAVAAAPSQVMLGCGKDAVVERHRGVESSLPCRMHSGPTGTPCSERYHHLI